MLWSISVKGSTPDKKCNSERAFLYVQIQKQSSLFNFSDPGEFQNWSVYFYTLVHILLKFSLFLETIKLRGRFVE